MIARRTLREREVRALALEAILQARRTWRGPDGKARRRSIDEELTSAMHDLMEWTYIWLRSPSRTSDVTKARKYADATKLVSDLRSAVLNKHLDRKQARAELAAARAEVTAS